MKIHLVGAMLVETAIAGCSPSEPRSTQYFEAHIDVARKRVLKAALQEAAARC